MRHRVSGSLWSNGMIKKPQTIYVEKGCETYPLGKQFDKEIYGHGVCPLFWVDDHNNIPSLRARAKCRLPKNEKTTLFLA